MRLVVFAGLPGSGKSTLARAVADLLPATLLRIDTIESAITTVLHPFEGNPVGYVTAEWIAEDQLRGGRDAVIDAVNNSAVARQGWIGLAERAGATLQFVEVVCSDPREHRRRVESRDRDWPGQGLPTWEQVVRRPWEPFDGARMLVDNIGDPAGTIHRILAELRQED